jgi:hypothetical protein
MIDDTLIAVLIEERNSASIPALDVIDDQKNSDISN